MTTFQHEAEFPVDPQHLFSWYEQPGTVGRLVPDWMMSVRREPTQGLHEGSVTEFDLGPTWADSLLPGAVPIRPVLRWKAVHQGREPGAEFTDTMASGPLASWTHRHQFLNGPQAGTTLLRDTVEYNLPGAAQKLPVAQRAFEHSLAENFAFRTRQTSADLDFHQQLRALRGSGAEPLTFLLAGASGLVGTQLSTLLRSGGHRVLRLLRRPGASQPWGTDRISWDPSQGELDPALLRGVDVVVNLAGQSILGPMTARHRRAVMDSRVDATRTLVRAMTAVVGDGGPQTLVSASASGYYGHDAGTVTEESPSGQDFLAEVCRAWEAEAFAAEQAGIRVVAVRTGLVLSARGGILGAQLPLYQAGLGGPMGGGRMWQPWLSLEDLIRIYAWAAMNSEVSGPVNAAAPAPVRQEEFARTLGTVLRRPAVLPTPGPAPALLLGPRGARELALASAALEPRVLQAGGYPFRFTDLEQALRHTLGRWTA